MSPAREKSFRLSLTVFHLISFAFAVFGLSQLARTEGDASNLRHLSYKYVVGIRFVKTPSLLY